MSDGTVISWLSWAELAALMRKTGMVTVEGVGRVDGNPAIGASLKIVNAETGEKLPDDLPFSVILFKDATQSGYTSIAMVARVPAAELNAQMPEGFLDACNRRYRFVHAYMLDRSSFVVQADLNLRGVTHEHLKYSFGVWAAAVSQILFDLMRAEPSSEERLVFETPAPVIVAAQQGGNEESSSNVRPFVSRPLKTQRSRGTVKAGAMISARPKRR